jgi:hypothetical protein
MVKKTSAKTADQRTAAAKMAVKVSAAATVLRGKFPLYPVRMKK